MGDRGTMMAVTSFLSMVASPCIVDASAVAVVFGDGGVCVATDSVVNIYGPGGEVTEQRWDSCKIMEARGAFLVLTGLRKTRRGLDVGETVRGLFDEAEGDIAQRLEAAGAALYGQLGTQLGTECKGPRRREVKCGIDLLAVGVEDAVPVVARQHVDPRGSREEAAPAPWFVVAPLTAEQRRELRAQMGAWIGGDSWPFACEPARLAVDWIAARSDIVAGPVDVLQLGVTGEAVWQQRKPACRQVE